MQEIAEHITRVQLKLQKLLKKHDNLLKETALQQEKIASLQEIQSAQAQKIRLLEEQQHIFKAAAGNMSPVDKKAFEQSINRYIREIDKCIALLSE